MEARWIPSMNIIYRVRNKDESLFYELSRDELLRYKKYNPEFIAKLLVHWERVPRRNEYSDNYEGYIAELLSEFISKKNYERIEEVKRLIVEENIDPTSTRFKGFRDTLERINVDFLKFLLSLRDKYPGDYGYYVSMLLSALIREKDYEGIEEVKKLIIEKNIDVNSHGFMIGSTAWNQDIREFIVRLNPEAIIMVIRRGIYDAQQLTPLLNIIKNMEEGRRKSTIMFRLINESLPNNSTILLIPLVESSLFNFEDLYNRIVQIGDQFIIRRLNKIIERQI